MLVHKFGTSALQALLSQFILMSGPSGKRQHALIAGTKKFFFDLYCTYVYLSPLHYEQVLPTVHDRRMRQKCGLTIIAVANAMGAGARWLVDDRQR